MAKEDNNGLFLAIAVLGGAYVLTRNQSGSSILPVGSSGGGVNLDLSGLFGGVGEALSSLGNAGKDAGGVIQTITETAGAAKDIVEGVGNLKENVEQGVGQAENWLSDAQEALGRYWNTLTGGGNNEQQNAAESDATKTSEKNSIGTIAGAEIIDIAAYRENLANTEEVIFTPFQVGEDLMDRAGDFFINVIKGTWPFYWTLDRLFGGEDKKENGVSENKTPARVIDISVAPSGGITPERTANISQYDFSRLTIDNQLANAEARSGNKAESPDVAQGDTAYSSPMSSEVDIVYKTPVSGGKSLAENWMNVDWGKIYGGG